MKIHRLESLEDFKTYYPATLHENREHLKRLETLIPDADREFTVEGFSYPAGKAVDFACSFRFSSGFPDVNWRETAFCPITGLQTRKRAALHVFDLFSNTYYSDDIYLMEQTTPLYSYLKASYPALTGSEYLGNAVPSGHNTIDGIRNEDATALSFADEQFSAVLSFEVFEHIFAYEKAFAECHRILKPGGCLLFTVPFAAGGNSHVERAIVLENGQIEHLLPPEYHGDSRSRQKVLCFRYYGWDMLRELRQCGFSEACALMFHSDFFGYFTEQTVFYCRK